MRMKKIWCAHRVYTMLLVLQMLFCFYVSPANAEPMQSVNENSIHYYDTSANFWALMKQAQKQDKENDSKLLYVLCGLLVLYVGTKVFVSHTDDKKSS